jgi:hypothetical protein
MKDKLNELMKLAKQVRSTIQINGVDDQTIQVSTWMNVRRSGKEYYSISFFSGITSRKLEVSLFEKDNYVSNSITIDVENISDDELDEIILRSKEDIITFIAKLDSDREQRRLKRIKELQNQLSELEGNVSTN